MANNTSVQYYVVDAFTESVFKGNPAAVCLLEEEREDEWLKGVAREFNLSETCYLIRITDAESLTPSSAHKAQIPKFKLRWFTPVAEVRLCGHATLAAAHSLFSSGLVTSDVIEFFTLSGVLTAKRSPLVNKASALESQDGQAGGKFLIELDFPVLPLVDCDAVEVSSIRNALSGASVIDMKRAENVDDILVELSSGEAVADFQPQIDMIRECPGSGLIITGPAPPNSGFDFYSRYFCPKYGIDEDPVTGSVHCALAPYWSKKLDKRDFVAYQASPRGGILHLYVDEQSNRVFLKGQAVTVMKGTLVV